MAKSLGSKVRTAEATNAKRPFFEPNGRYKVKIEEVKYIVSRKKDELVVISAEIIESTTKLSTGTVAVQFINMDSDMGPGNFKAFVCAALGQDTKDNTLEESDYNEAAGLTANGEEESTEPHPLAGIVMNLETVLIKTKAGTDFTVHNWSTG